MTLRNQCQLITYADSLGENMTDLHYVLKHQLDGCFGGVHILPFFPSSADRGFAPLTYNEVDPKFGHWRDIDCIGAEFDLMADFMVNHISQQSEYFKDFKKNKDKSKYADLFLRLTKFHPSGRIPDEDIKEIYTRKPRAPFIDVNFPDGSLEKVWCTFDTEQIDLDAFSEVGRNFLRRQITGLARRNVKIIRCDAFGYTVKKLGTNCFFVEPETSNLLRTLSDHVKPFNVQLLPEIHEHYTIQLKLSHQGYWVYDFALPLLVLHALYAGEKHNLEHWFSICPRKQFTTLDTHDGLPVVDVADLMKPEEIEETKEMLYSKGANVHRRYSTDPAYKNLDVYQINCTYYSALGDNDQAYLAARAIQFFAPGIPQVYYVGALAGKNDIERVESTKIGREINRHNYTVDEIDTEIERPVVQRLIKMMKFRNTFPAFQGEFKQMPTDEDHILKIHREFDSYQACLTINLKDHDFTIKYRGPFPEDWKELEI